MCFDTDRLNEVTVLMSLPFLVVYPANFRCQVMTQSGDSGHHHEFVAGIEGDPERVAVTGVCLTDEDLMTLSAIEYHANGLTGPLKNHRLQPPDGLAIGVIGRQLIAGVLGVGRAPEAIPRVRQDPEITSFYLPVRRQNVGTAV